MSDESELAQVINKEPPWWSTAPLWLAASIVGVPSFIAISAGFYVAQHVSASLSQLTTYNQSEIYLLNEQINQTKHDMSVVLRFVQDELRAQYATCVNSAKTDRERSDCLSPSEREELYGITRKKRSPSTGP